MDKALAGKPRWRMYVLVAAGLALALGTGVWVVNGSRGSVYRVPLNRLTIATVTEGSFEDYIAVRGAVAPFIIDYLTTDQGGTVKQVLVEDGARPAADHPFQSGAAASGRGPAAHLRTESLQIRKRSAGYRTPDQQTQKRSGARQSTAGRQRHRPQYLQAGTRRL